MSLDQIDVYLGFRVGVSGLAPKPETHANFELPANELFRERTASFGCELKSPSPYWIVLRKH